MKIALVILACVIGITILALLVRRRIAPAYAVTARDIPEVISRLQRSSKDGHFAVLMFVPPGSSDGGAVNLQYSIQQGAVGLDWVLQGPRDIADEKRIREFVSEAGYRFVAQEMNGVRYWRVTGSGISDLGAKIVREFYQIDPDTKLGLITQGFRWQTRLQS